MGVGLLGSIVPMIFGGSGNRLKDTVEIFRPNAEASAIRHHEMDAAALQQLSTEFMRPQRGLFDAFVDGLNRLPRPVIVLALIYLVALPIFSPIRATEVYTALVLVPDALWALVGIVIAFYFGGRMQVKDLEFTRSMAGAAASLPAVLNNLKSVRELSDQTPLVAATGTDAETELVAVGTDDDTDNNPAIQAWREGRGAGGTS